MMFTYSVKMGTGVLQLSRRSRNVGKLISGFLLTDHIVVRSVDGHEWVIHMDS